jgi:hypothetical protein
MLNFENNPNIEKLHEEEIWLYKNFLSKEEVSEIYDVCKNLNEESWHGEELSDHTIEFYNGRTSKRVFELLPVKEKIESLVQGYEVTPGESFARMFPEDTMHEHEDSCGEEGTTDTDMNNTCAITEYGCVVYINNDFEGGELYYPKLGLSYTPSAGDLVIHGSRIKHGVAEVKSGMRYVYPTFLYRRGN